MEALYIKSNGGYRHLIIEGDGGLILETNNPLEYSFGKASKTYSITIPNVGDNNVLLDNLFYKVTNHTVVFNEIFYKIDEGVYLQGILKVYNFNRREARGQFVSQYSQLWDVLKNTKLNEIDYVESTNALMQFTLSDIAIEDSDALDLIDGDVILDLIDRGRTREHQDTLNASLDGVTNVITNGVDVAERFPAVRVKRILANIFKDYNLTGNFFDNTFYDKLYLAFTQERANTTNDEIFVSNNKFTASMQDDFVTKSNFSSAQFGFNVTYNLPLNQMQDNINTVYNTSTRTFTVAETGVYDIKFNSKGTANVTGSGVGAAVGSIKMQVIDGDTEALIYEREVPHTYTQSILPTSEIVGDFSVSLSTGNILLQPGVSYKFRVNFNAVVTASSDWSRSVKVSRSGTYIKVVPSTYYGYGSVVNTKDIMPNLKVSDFIKYLLKEFNIELYVSQEKNEIVFYQRKFNESAINLTPYIVDNTVSVQTNPDKTNWVFKHKLDGGDNYFSTIYNNDPSINGEYEFNIGAEETNTFESEFSMTAEVPINKWGMTSNARMWSSYEEPDLSTKFNYRLLLDAGIANCNYISYSPTGGSTKTQYRKLSTAISGFNYKFNGSLFNTFHLGNITNLTEGTLIELELKLPVSVISNFYNLENNFWLNSFYISTDIVKGYFVLLSLNKIDDNTYRGKFYEIRNVQTSGSFNKDFFDDFNN